MKYNININQKALSKYDIDIKDMAIFDYIYVMCASVNKNIEKERFKGHTWINYEKLIKDMPALRIKSRNSISKRISILEESGLITTEKKMVKGHRRVFVKLTTLSDSVFVESTERVLSDEKRVRESVQDNYTIDNYTIDNSDESQIPLIIDLFVKNKLSASAKTWFGNKTQRKACKDLLEEFNFEDIEKIITKVLPETNQRPRYEFPYVDSPFLLREHWYKLANGFKAKEATKKDYEII